MATKDTGATCHLCGRLRQRNVMHRALRGWECFDLRQCVRARGRASVDAQRVASAPMPAKRYMVRMQLTEDELRGLAYVTDSLSEHFKEAAGTGFEDSDRWAKDAAAWIGRASRYAYAHPLRNGSRRL